MKIICSNSIACQFAWEVFDFLSKHYVINLISGRGPSLFQIQNSPFGNRSTFSDVWREGKDLPLAIKISGADYYLSDDWYKDKSKGALSIENLKDFVKQITKGKYGIKVDGDDYLLVEHVMTIPTTADNLIRADYSYLRSLNPHFGAMPASQFDLTSNILASTGNVSFLALMDRIPVYIVDSRFMQENFEKDDKHWEILKLLKNILHLLEEILGILQERAEAEGLPTLLEKTRGFIEKLYKFKEYEYLISKINRFLVLIEDSINRYGVSGTIRSNNFVSALRRIIDEFPQLAVSTEALGVYCHEWERNGFHEKAIFICWERIHDCADRGHAIDLLTKVTIHEFCHAYMDVIAGSGRACKDIYHWMEESMANVLSLKVIENYVIKHPSAIQLFEYAKSFMLKQPDAYASAVRLWENGICDYDLWAWNKDKCVAANSIKNWYNEMSASWKTITNGQIRELWNEVKQEILCIK